LPSSTPRHRQSPVLRVNLQGAETFPEEIRHDIEVMRQEALERLEALEHQMEELQEDVANEHASLDSMEGDMAVTAFFEEPIEQQTSLQEKQQHLIIEEQDREETILHAPLDLLDNTRWKVAYTIGREPGTWMPPEWGASGERLRFQVVLDFTNTPADSRDEFFMGGSTKICKVVDAFSFPTGVGKSSVGRKPLAVEATGAYGVAREKGPAGTDLLRFYIQFDQDVFNEHTDVYIPAGRVYGTCGYFSTAPHSHAPKERLAQEHLQLTRAYGELQREMDMETQLFSMDRVRLMKEQWDVRHKAERVAKELKRAKQHDPERAQLRLSAKGNVGLTREGGVCCKVYKNAAIEYRILGRMELGCVEKHDDETDENHRLHP
jgi:hypothetical protein